MKKNKKVTIRFEILLIVLLLLFFFMSFAGLLIDNKPVYNFIWSVTKTNADKEESSMIVSYILDETKTLPKVLTRREKDHLSDVQELIYKLSKILSVIVIAIISTLIFSKNLDWEFILKYVSYSLIILPILIVFLFPITFNLAHKMVFDAGSWIFDATTTTLVNLYTESFFKIIGLIWLILCLFSSSVLLIIKKKAL